MGKRLPEQIGLDVDKALLWHPYQQAFLQARRLRLCPICKQVVPTSEDGLLHHCDQIIADARRLYDRFGLFAGRRGAKSVSGAHGMREEVLVPNTLHWICGPTYEILHDATMPTFLRLLPKEWCADWDAEHLQLTLINHTRVAFRSLDDPDRAHGGVGLHSAWLDEAAFISDLAWEYLEPALADYRGAAYFTSSVDGYDWTYERVEKPALVTKTPGYWAAKWTTVENPAIPPEEVEKAKRTKPPAIFRQEYEASRENFTGSVYGEFIDDAWLPDDAAIREHLPEWPDINPDRKILVGLDSGADHPFGASVMVVTETAIIAIREYIERQRAVSQHLPVIRALLPTGNTNVLFAANRNEANMRLEFAAQGIGVGMAENDQQAGIQRVLSWLYTKRLKIAYTCPRTFEQMKQLRFAENTGKDRQKRVEKVFKLNDELPDCIRYALMLWPQLPVAAAPVVGRDLTRVSPKTRWEIEKMAGFHAQKSSRDLTPVDQDYPAKNFYQSVGDEYETADMSVFGGE